MPVEASLPRQGVSAMGKYLAVGIVSAGEAVVSPGRLQMVFVLWHQGES